MAINRCIEFEYKNLILFLMPSTGQSCLVAKDAPSKNRRAGYDHSIFRQQKWFQSRL